MKNSSLNSITCITLVTALISSAIAPTGLHSDAAAKARLASKNLIVKKGSRMTIVIKHKNKKAKYTYSSSKTKIATVSKKGVITGKKAGTSKIKVKEKLGRKTRSLGTINVKVINNTTATSYSPTNTPASSPSDAKITSAPSLSGSSSSSSSSASKPTSTPKATPAPTRAPLVFDDVSTPKDFNVKKPGVSYGNTERITYHSGTTGTDRHAIVITPPDYNPDLKYPVLYLCHGGNGDENDWLDGTPDLIYGNLLDSGDTIPMIMVLVNCRARADDKKDPKDSLSDEHMKAWTDFLFELQDDLMPYMEKEYPILTGRENAAIAGFSMGGRESLYIGFNIPDKIGYIGAFSPAFGIFEYTNFGYHENGYFTEDTFTLPAEYMDNTTCVIMNGANDSMVRDEPEKYHNALVNNGVNHYYYTIPGDHNMEVWRNGLYNFLKIVFR